MGSGQDPPKRGAAFFFFLRVFREQWGTLMPSSSTAKRQGPDPAHLRVLWWNNSKCLSCIVWHAAGGALKPFLPPPKAPLNKIVKNNSFTLIFPSDYRTQGGKLAAGPHASLLLSAATSLFSSPCVSASLISVHHPSPSLCSIMFWFPIFLVSICLLSVWHAR